MVSDELNDVAKTYGTPRRRCCWSPPASRSRAAVPLEVADDPCFVYLSSSGLLARTTDTEPPGRRRAAAPSTTWSSPRSAPPPAARSARSPAPGRLVKLDVLDLPTLPGHRQPPAPAGRRPGQRVPRRSSAGERVLALTSLDAGLPRSRARAPAQGVVKRVNPELLANRDAWEVVRLADGDEVVGAVELRTGEEELCFVTSDAQLLHFPAAAVRPQGRSGGGIAGVRLGGQAAGGVLRRLRPRRQRRSW